MTDIAMLRDREDFHKFVDRLVGKICEVYSIPRRYLEGVAPSNRAIELDMDIWYEHMHEHMDNAVERTKRRLFRRTFRRSRGFRRHMRRLKAQQRRGIK